MIRHTYEVALSENELKEIINSLCGVEANGHPLSYEERQVLAKRLESELWAPYHQSVAIGRRTR